MNSDSEGSEKSFAGIGDHLKDLNGAIEEGREKLGEFANKGLNYVSSADSMLSGIVRQEPILAMVGAFAIGYVAARLLNQASRR